MTRTYHIITFGCQMNVNDSDWLGRALQQRGFVAGELADADVVIVNTCSVRDKPEQKVYSTLGRVRQVTRGRRSVLVVVAGCVAQQIGSGFFKRFPQVRLILGSDGMAHAPEAIEKLCAQPGLKLSLVDFSTEYPERDTALTGNQLSPVAYVNIMQGCDNFCAYCIVPFTRGRQKSRSREAVLAECRALLQGGTREITLLGQNVNSYGQDSCGDGTTFGRLLRDVAALPGLERLRFVTPHPKDISSDVIAAFGELPNLCPRLHLPLQAGSDRVLDRMGRKYNSAKFLHIVDQLRTVRPDIAISTDLIVGFPGETEEDFQATLHMMREVGFMSSFSFCYSDRPGARAVLFPDKIAPAVQQDRLSRLQALQDELGAAWLQSRVDDTASLLLENNSRKTNTDGESWQGRDIYGATVNITLPQDVGRCGLLIPSRITEAKKHSLNAVPTGAAW